MCVANADQWLDAECQARRGKGKVLQDAVRVNITEEVRAGPLGLGSRLSSVTRYPGDLEPHFAQAEGAERAKSPPASGVRGTGRWAAAEG